METAGRLWATRRMQRRQCIWPSCADGVVWPGPMFHLLLDVGAVCVEVFKDIRRALSHLQRGRQELVRTAEYDAARPPLRSPGRGEEEERGHWSLPLPVVEEVQNNVQGTGPLVSKVEETALQYQHPASEDDKREHVGPLVSATDRVSFSCPPLPNGRSVWFMCLFVGVIAKMAVDRVLEVAEGPVFTETDTFGVAVK